MKKKKISQENFFGLVIASIFSVGVNQYYANLGVFPHDSFSHFDTGNMILNGFHPFSDFWIVSGPFIDYFQALLFFLFGTSWKVYVFHASLINLIVTLFTFITLRSLKLNFQKSLFFTLCFSILAYPSSGTPFVDHHSSFLSLIGIYFILMCIKKDSKILTFFVPVFFILAFLSKQVPSSYLFLVTIPIFFCYIFLNKKNYLFLPFFYGAATFTLLIIFFGLLNSIELKNFLDQYFFYPQSIASKRFENFHISIPGVIGNFKFILISLLILIFTSFKDIKKPKLFKNKKIYIVSILTISTLILIFHQLLTRNQIFIFFLIPLIIGVANININHKALSIFTIVLCLGSTIKYHERFNEGRKFHELQNVNINKAIDANIIDTKLNGLKWITPQFRDNPSKEIQQIKEIKLILKKDNRKKMVLGNYPFLSAILNQNLHSTTRWHVFDGTDYPLPSNKYFKNYKNLMHQVIKKNNIKVIYSILPVAPENIQVLFKKNCLDETQLTEYIVKFDLQNCIK